MPLHTRFLFGAALVGTLSSCVRTAPPSIPASIAGGYDMRVSEDIARLRAATDPFHNLDAAVAAGYPRTVADCLIHEQHGAMGYHHLNRSYVDAKLEVEHPEILLYERLADNTYRLNGVEFIVPFSVWPRDSVPPTLMGQTLHREENLKIWYLHVWAWTNNRDGIFSGFNPDVKCLNGTGKVYTPTVEAP
jgi:hypothetical protein